MRVTGYNALEQKNSGMVIACPMPVIRSRVRASPAIVIDRQQKNIEPDHHDRHHQQLDGVIGQCHT
jgi:hypothetical protein